MISKKILHVAVFTPISTNVYQAEAFESLGHEVIRYDYRRRAVDLGRRIRSDNPGRDNELIELCKTEKPDFILLSKCDKMDVRVIQECRKVGKTVLWFMDGPHNFDNELMEKVKNSDYVFCSFKCCVELAERYCNNSYKLHEGFDRKSHYPMDIPKTRDVVFIGEMRPFRQVFKRGWDFEVITNAYNEEHSKVVSETKINLNMNKGKGTSDRFYKILASKGFMLTTPFETMNEDFTVGKDFDIFSTPEELKEKIEYYLVRDDKREEIALHGYESVQKYDNLYYASEILRRINYEN